MWRNEGRLLAAVTVGGVIEVGDEKRTAAGMGFCIGPMAVEAKEWRVRHEVV